MEDVTENHSRDHCLKLASSAELRFSGLQHLGAFYAAYTQMVYYYL